VESRKNEENAKRLAEEERARGEEVRKNEVIARRNADHERQMRLIAEAKAEALEREMSKMRVNFSAGWRMSRKSACICRHAISLALSCIC